jgi:iron(III) transport system ATP-binding protein
MLAIHDLTVRYGSRVAVEHFDLVLDPGEIVTLVGPTGCGKSSVLRAVAGLERPAAGEIVIGGLRIDRDRNPPPEKRRTGLVFQDFALFPHLTVAGNVGFRVRDPALVDHWIETLGLAGHRDAMPATLSGGQKQRVALARALAHEPALVLLDEPLSNLDAALKANLRWQIRDALKGAGVPAIWVTHDQDEALSVGDRVGVMNEGRLEQVGEPEHCYREPRTRFVARFLGDGVFLRGRIGGGCVTTVAGRSVLGNSDTAERLARNGEVDVLVRPHDLGLEPDPRGNARVIWGRYEGETRLYCVRLHEGPELQARVSHELRLAEGQNVQTRIAARHALALFGPESP